MKKNTLISVLIIIFATVFLIFLSNNKKEKNENKIKTKQANNKKIKSKILKLVSTNKLVLDQKTNVIKEISVLELKTDGKSKKLEWNEKTVRFYIDSIKPPNRYKYVDNRVINIITNTAIANNINVPTNIFSFTQFILEFPSTNDNDICRVLDIVHSCTNEMLSDFLLSQFTNYYNEKYVLPGWSNPIDRSSACLWAIQTIGTPELIDKLNKALIELNKNNRRFKEPGQIIDPDRFPKEAENWLFNSPYNKVKDSMAGNWLGSERPETVDVLRRYIKKLEKLDEMNPFFIDGWREDDKPHMKKLRLKRLNDQVDRYERRYKRWIEDDKRMPLFYGTYSNGSWEEYKNESEEERKLKYLDAYKAKVPIQPGKLRRLKNQRLNRRYKPTKRNSK